jgi:hypothetical protein
VQRNADASAARLHFSRFGSPAAGIPASEQGCRAICRRRRRQGAWHTVCTTPGMRRVVALLAVIILVTGSLPVGEIAPRCGSCCDGESMHSDAQASPCCRVAPAAPRSPVRSVDAPAAAAPQAAAGRIPSLREAPPEPFPPAPPVSDRLVRRMRLIAIRI